MFYDIVPYSVSSVTKWQKIVKYLAIYNNENLPKNVSQFAKAGPKLSQQLLNNASKNAKDKIIILPNWWLVTLSVAYKMQSEVEMRKWAEIIRKMQRPISASADLLLVWMSLLHPHERTSSTIIDVYC